MFDWIFTPWPWYVAGPLLGFMVPLLMRVDNKRLGISSVLWHICAAVLPARIPFFNYNWKNEKWNLLFVLGIFFGAMIATYT
ncbi:MAG: YeeE/YedE family protein, partial [Sediminibacterium sp.]|nr:YeeE/YedE family protein [Sediminibacterium sp.]